MVSYLCDCGDRGFEAGDDVIPKQARDGDYSIYGYALICPKSDGGLRKQRPPRFFRLREERMGKRIWLS